MAGPSLPFFQIYDMFQQRAGRGEISAHRSFGVILLIRATLAAASIFYCVTFPVKSWAGR